MNNIAADASSQSTPLPILRESREWTLSSVGEAASFPSVLPAFHLLSTDSEISLFAIMDSTALTTSSA
jgi:hypothetical protein